MKILWHSNSPWAPTGYGQQTRLFAPRLAEHHEIAISSFYGLQGDRLNWDGITVYPNLGNEFGNDYMIQRAERYFGEPRGGLVLPLMDVWVLNPAVMAQLDMACWVPVDHEPVPPAVAGFFANSGAIPLAMSRFGERQLEQFNPIYVPHGIPDVFRPYAKAQMREQLGADKDAFLIGMVAANKGSRKSFQEAFQAFKVFHDRHPEAQLYLHTEMSGAADGLDLIAMKDGMGIPDEAMRMADQYRMNFAPLPAEIMARLYSTFDVLLNPAAGEGFGVPIVEAQACGVPVIVTDFSAMKEVCGAGWKVGYQGKWTAQKSWQATPIVEEIVHALEECYGLSSAERQALQSKAVAHAEQYGVERVMDEHFLPALVEVEQRIADRKPMKLRAVA